MAHSYSFFPNQLGQGKLETHVNRGLTLISRLTLSLN